MIKIFVTRVWYVCCVHEQVVRVPISMDGPIFIKLNGKRDEYVVIGISIPHCLTERIIWILTVSGERIGRFCPICLEEFSGIYEKNAQ